MDKKVHCGSDPWEPTLPVIWTPMVATWYSKYKEGNVHACACVCTRPCPIVCICTHKNKQREKVRSDSSPTPICPPAHDQGSSLYHCSASFLLCVSAMIRDLPEVPVLLGISPLRSVHAHFTPFPCLSDTEEQRSLLKIEASLQPFGC